MSRSRLDEHHVWTTTYSIHMRHWAHLYNNAQTQLQEQEDIGWSLTFISNALVIIKTWSVCQPMHVDLLPVNRLLVVHIWCWPIYIVCVGKKTGHKGHLNNHAFLFAMIYPKDLNHHGLVSWNIVCDKICLSHHELPQTTLHVAKELYIEWYPCHVIMPCIMSSWNSFRWH